MAVAQKLVEQEEFTTHRNYRPVDLVHLARQSLGNKDLEQEVLMLFIKQTDLYMERLQSGASREQMYSAAHTIKGSARSIGAWKVALNAEHIEKSTNQNQIVTEEAINDLEISYVEAKTFICTLL